MAIQPVHSCIPYPLPNLGYRFGASVGLGLAGAGVYLLCQVQGSLLVRDQKRGNVLGTLRLVDVKFTTLTAKTITAVRTGNSGAQFTSSPAKRLY